MEKVKKVCLVLASLFAGLNQVSVAQVFHVFNGSKADVIEQKADSDAVSAKAEPKGYSFGQGGLVMYEDFESCSGANPYPFPDGWTVLGTEEDVTDRWIVSAMSDVAGFQIWGHSGEMYAFILAAGGTIGHDAWAITPALRLEGGISYELRFWLMMPDGGGDVMEHLEVMFGNANDPAALTTLVWEEDDAFYEDWTLVRCTLEPEETGDYYLGFHSLSQVGSSATAVDDICVMMKDSPVFYGVDTLDLGHMLDLDPGVVVRYTFQNKGTEDMELATVSVPEGMEVLGLPLTVKPDSVASFNIIFDVDEVGQYSEELVLGLNNENASEIRIRVLAYIKKARVTGYNYEDFEHGTPEDWSILSFNVVPNEGVDKSNGLWSFSSFSSKGFQTHYIDMGDDPIVSFMYRLESYETQHEDPGDPADSNYVRMRIAISDDYGQTFDEFYAILPPGDDTSSTAPAIGQYHPTSDFTRLTVEVPDEYKNKLCLVNISMDGTGFTGEYLATFDNMAFGTPHAQDIALVNWYGNSLLTVGTPETYKVNVKNLGIQATGDYTVRIMDGETVLSSQFGSNLAPDSTQEYTFYLNYSNPVLKSLHADVVMEGDEDTANNRGLVRDIRINVDSIDQVEVAEDAPSLSESVPFSFGYRAGAVQTLYTANELGRNSGNLTGLRYYLTDGLFEAPMQVWIAETDKKDFTDTVWLDTATMAKVFDRWVYFPDGESYVDIPFSNPYPYKGGNLVVYTRSVKEDLYVGKTFVAHDRMDDAYQGRTLIAEAVYPEYFMLEGYPSVSSIRVASEMPKTTFFFEPIQSGSIHGVVSDSEGSVEDAKVSVSGTQLYAMTDEEGAYSISGLAVGTYDIVVEAFGYASHTEEGVEVAADQETELDIMLSEMEAFTFSGKIVSAQSGAGIPDATVKLLGFANYKATTDAQGAFSIAGVYGGFDYKLEVSAPYYHRDTATVSMEADVTEYSMVLEERIYPVWGLNTIADGGSLDVFWNEPQAEYRYDNGIAVGQIGYQNYGEVAVMGSVYRNNAIVREITWFLTDDGGENPLVNLYLFDLDENGEPTTDVIWSEKDVPNTVMQWNTYQLPQEVECPNGFLVGMSVDEGFLSLGMSSLSDEWPLTSGMHYAIDNYNQQSYTFADMSEYYQRHMMIRVSGEDLGEIDYTDYSNPEIADPQRKAGMPSVPAFPLPVMSSLDEPVHAGVLPSIDNGKGLAEAKSDVSGKSFAKSYKVYRLEEGQDESDWKLLTEDLIETMYSDSEWAALAPGTYYRYAVVAVYAEGESDPVLSNAVTPGVGNEDVAQAGVRVSPNPAVNYVEVFSDGKALGDVRLLDLSGRLLARWHEVGQDYLRVDMSALPQGLYLLEVDGKIYKIAKR